jgi:hypothetical protein
MDRYPKDEQLKGIYVKRCKCGARPYMDRIMVGSIPKWLKCDSCGRTTDSDCDKQVAIDNWNKDKINYNYLI